MAGYYIGNSLTSETWGAGPNRIKGILQDNGYFQAAAGHNIECGRPLTGIYNTPGSTCETPVPALWPIALASSWDYLCVQPHAAGTTSLSTDVEAILAWAALQPDAFVVLYSAVPPQADLLSFWGASEPALSPAEDPTTLLQRAYTDALWDALEPTLGARLRLAPVAEVAYEIALQAGAFPGVDSLDDLFVKLFGESEATHGSAIARMAAALTIATVVAGEPITSGPLLGVSEASVTAILAEIATVCAADSRTRVTFS